MAMTKHHGIPGDLQLSLSKAPLVAVTWPLTCFLSALLFRLRLISSGEGKKRISLLMGLREF